MSNDDKPFTGSVTQVGHPKAPEPSAPRSAEAPRTRSPDRGFADTLPTVNPQRVQLQTSNTTDDLVSSAPARAIAGHAQASGYVTLSGERVAEALARELIARRMTQDGFDLEEDYAYSYGDLLVNLDGFDVQRSVGFQYVSHADADVVTDLDTGVEEQLRQLGAQGIAHVLIIHDHDATTAEVVVERVEAFLAQLPG
jgi:hypothetical protein